MHTFAPHYSSHQKGRQKFLNKKEYGLDIFNNLNGQFVTRSTYSFTFEAVGFGDPQARVLFDLGAAAGLVNLDNVSLVLN